MQQSQSRRAFVVRVGVLVAIFAAGSIQPALAYVDPNSGGILFQIVTPLIVIISGAFALLKRRISDKFKSLMQWKTRFFKRDSRPE